MIALLFSPLFGLFRSLALPRYALVGLLGVGLLAVVHGGVSVFEHAENVAIQKAGEAAVKGVEAQVAKQSEAVVRQQAEKMRSGLEEFSKHQIDTTTQWNAIADQTEKVTTRVEPAPIQPVPVPDAKPVRKPEPHAHKKPRHESARQSSAAVDDLNRASAAIDGMLRRESTFP